MHLSSLDLALILFGCAFGRIVFFSFFKRMAPLPLGWTKEAIVEDAFNK